MYINYPVVVRLYEYLPHVEFLRPLPESTLIALKNSVRDLATKDGEKIATVIRTRASYVYYIARG